MTFTEKIEKLLAANHIKEVIDEFFKFLNEVPQSKTDARSDANQLRGQIIVLSGRFTELNTKINTNTVNAEAANQEKAAVINSFIQILNQLPSNYPDLNIHLQEKNEDDEWYDAQKKNTIDAYQVYFNKYPNGKYKADTIKLISELEEVKLKQDTEIKRLALLEKERRANDKLTGESQKVQAGTMSQPTYQSVAAIASSPPVKSKKGLFIGLGVVALIALIIFLTTGKESLDDVATPIDVEEASSAGPSEAVKAELISVIRLANQAEIQSTYDLNTDPLAKYYTGEALKTALSSLDWLKTNGLFAEAKLEQQNFQTFNVSNDGLEAELEIEEIWTYILYNSSNNNCYGKLDSNRIQQKVYLKKGESGWMITAFIDNDINNKQLDPCD